MTSSDGWLSDEDLKAAMTLEKDVYGLGPGRGAHSTYSGEGTTDLARRLFKENAGAAANSIIQLAKHSSNENTRFKAASYVLERALGPVNMIKPNDSGDDPLMAMVAALNNNTTGPTDQS